MGTFWSKFKFIPAAALLTAGFCLPASAQVVCNVNSALPALARAEGNTEPLGDMVLTCTGGTPTPAGDPVPQVNITVFINTNLTSKITASSGPTNFDEALLLIDEPNRLVSPTIAVIAHPLLNCGQAGAPDKGPSGPGVCEIVSTGNPAQTYDGTPYGNATGICTSGAVNITVVPAANYGCGRPNAFQGRMESSLGTNVLVFNGVPFDPSGAGTRILRITNLRADAALLTPSNPISAEIVIQGSSSITFTGGSNSSTPVEIGFVQKGLTASAPAALTVRVEEGFANSWKARNISNTLANAIFMAGAYVYHMPDASDPAQAAQNIPGVLYNTEDGFQWQNNTTNAPPSPNPPAGFGSGSASSTNYPLNSVGYSGVNTGINADGVSSAGTRVALKFTTAAASITVPSVVYLHEAGSPSTISGVMVLTSTDANGAGPFTPGAITTIHSGGMAVYEVLYADPFAIEYADIECALPGFFSSASVTANLAPFYTVPAATIAEPSTYPIPRFSTADSTTVTISSFVLVPFFPFF